jgi:hypothetical protein
MGMRRIAELLAMLMIGEGVLTIIAPRRHSLLWEFGPEGYRRSVEAFAERPTLSTGWWPQPRLGWAFGWP